MFLNSLPMFTGHFLSAIVALFSYSVKMISFAFFLENLKQKQTMGKQGPRAYGQTLILDGLHKTCEAKSTPLWSANMRRPRTYRTELLAPLLFLKSELLLEIRAGMFHRNSEHGTEGHGTLSVWAI